MSDIRTRLAEALAMPTDTVAQVFDAATALVVFCKQPALARALEDEERMDWLERVGFATNNRPLSRADEPSVHCWRDSPEWKWTAAYRGSEFSSAREAIDAARKKP